MKFINENAAAITVLLLAVGMAVGATVWVVTEVNNVRNDLSNTERRLTETINENAAGIAEINERLDRIEQRMDRADQRFETILDAIANHSHAEEGPRRRKAPPTPKTKTRPRRDGETMPTTGDSYDLYEVILIEIRRRLCRPLPRHPRRRVPGG